MRVSVALAAYNGKKYINAQINSILKQLGIDDELVISCDPSSDGSEEIIELLAAQDKRIKYLRGPGKGILANFESAILACSGDYIFLSDQDDIWLDNKIQFVLDVMEEKQAGVVIHDARVVDENLNIISSSLFKQKGSHDGFLGNIIKNSFVGCCMAFRKELKSIVLPFPDDLPMHDQWIGLLGEKFSSVYFLHEQLLLYRRHSDNASSDVHATVLQMIKWRIALIYNLRKRELQCRQKK